MSLPPSRSNSNSNNTFDDLLPVCWHLNDCWPCLEEKSAHCSWCPSSMTCIPNLSRPQILAPITNADICPLWSERWEVRTSGLGCHVSTITLLTCVVSVLSTFLVMGLVVLGFRVVRWVGAKWKMREEGWWKFWRGYKAGWWKGWRVRLVDVRRDEERAPLLVSNGETRGD
ncbi:hypothetical protein N431DRAFT_3780 [Stipitochalara longipes BDJ]|nr:hypothetical protein N431DRAFT_3780 [Stipitochalara longipes BDJ]